MRLIINSGSVYKGGAEQVAISFVHECINFPQHEYHWILAPNLASQVNQAEFTENFRFHLIKRRPASGIIHFIKMMIWYKQLEKKIKPDCVISTGGHGFWRPKAPLVGAFNEPHYIYPESPYYSIITLKKKIYWRIMRILHMYLYNRLDVILVQTEDVKKRLKNLLSRNIPIYVISNTINGHYLSDKVYQKKLPDKNPGEIRLLTLSSHYPHKNLGIINSVANLLQENGAFNFRFVVTLPDGKFQETFGEDKSGMIFNVGPVPVKECPSLYRECDFMFLPTLLECFSASYVEAMVMKKPILTSDLSFARTVCRDAAVYFNPLDAEDITCKIIQLSEDHEKQKGLIKKGIRIKNTIPTPLDRARKFLEICSQISK